MDFGDISKWVKGIATGDNFQLTVRRQYFPEIWYIIENYFSLTKNKNVLEVGCGNGLIADALAKSEWEVTCVDPVLECLLKTQERFAASGVEGRFEQADPESLPFGNNSFDRVVSINLLETAGSRTRTIREIHRVLKPGGHAVLATFAKNGLWSRIATVNEFRNEDRSEIARFMGKRDFVRLLQKEKLKIERLKGCARYLPSSGEKKINVPMTGAYVALVKKPELVEEVVDDEEGSTRVGRKG